MQLVTDRDDRQTYEAKLNEAYARLQTLQRQEAELWAQRYLDFSELAFLLQVESDFQRMDKDEDPNPDKVIPYGKEAIRKGNLASAATNARKAYDRCLNKFKRRPEGQVTKEAMSLVRKKVVQNTRDLRNAQRRKDAQKTYERTRKRAWRAKVQGTEEGRAWMLQKWRDENEARRQRKARSKA